VNEQPCTFCERSNVCFFINDIGRKKISVKSLSNYSHTPLSTYAAVVNCLVRFQ
jgi:hypothetical protein